MGQACVFKPDPVQYSTKYDCVGSKVKKLPTPMAKMYQWPPDSVTIVPVHLRVASQSKCLSQRVMGMFANARLAGKTFALREVSFLA